MFAKQGRRNESKQVIEEIKTVLVFMSCWRKGVNIIAPLHRHRKMHAVVTGV